jgi:hypothetical protein
MPKFMVATDRHPEFRMNRVLPFSAASAQPSRTQRLKALAHKTRTRTLLTLNKA